jgi:hypothetical protein
MEAAVLTALLIFLLRLLLFLLLHRCWRAVWQHGRGDGGSCAHSSTDVCVAPASVSAAAQVLACCLATQAA